MNKSKRKKYLYGGKNMRSLACYLKEYKKESILAPFFKFLEVVFDLIVPLVIAQIIDVGVA